MSASAKRCGCESHLGHLDTLINEKTYKVLEAKNTCEKQLLEQELEALRGRYLQRRKECLECSIEARERYLDSLNIESPVRRNIEIEMIILKDKLITAIENIKQ
jgi:hypothetical protein